MHQETIVIIGAGQAGAYAARTLREQGHVGRLYLIGEESVAPYERPPLSKAFLLEETAAAMLTILDEAELKALDIMICLSEKVTRINRQSRSVYLESGLVINYDKLLITTGGRAALPAIEGATLPRVHRLRHIEDANRLREQLAQQPQQQVAVIGGGWIGLELAATCTQLGHQVTIIEATERLCQRSVDPLVSAKLEQLHLQHGTKIHYQTILSAIESLPEGLLLRFADGTEVVAQLAILAVGLKANDELATEAGLDTANGIRVNTQNQSSDPTIYAAGDVAVLPCAYSERGRRHESWQNAQDQGIAAAKAMLGDQANYSPTPMLWSEQFDVMLQVYGYVNHAHRVVVRSSPPKGSLLFYLNEEQKIIGVVLWNAGRDYRFARQLVDQKRQLSDAILTDSLTPLAKIAREEKIV